MINFITFTIKSNLVHSGERGLHSKITYTIVARNFDFETADFVFKNSRLKTKAQSDFITIDDILTILSTSNTLQEKIEIYGFITANDVRYELKLLNGLVKFRIF